MLAGKILFRPAAALISPDDLVEEAGFAELPVAHQACGSRHTPVQVKIEYARLVQEQLRDGNDPAQQAQVLFFAGIPVIIGRIAG